MRNTGLLGLPVCPFICLALLLLVRSRCLSFCSFGVLYMTRLASYLIIDERLHVGNVVNILVFLFSATIPLNFGFDPASLVQRDAAHAIRKQ